MDAEYSPQRSRPSQQMWFFVYTVQILNESQVSVQLMSRHWIITDAGGHMEEVRGPGVVGQQPVLAPGESFEYTSGCPIKEPFGSMRGTFQMMGGDGTRFDTEIAPFTLTATFTAH